jgi:chemotaxis protein CheD
MIDLKKYTVFPGQYIMTSAPALISTVLGSCVAVCLWDRATQMTGMNHYLLPGREGEEVKNASRGMIAIPLLIQSMINRKAEKLEAKIFGGCNSLYQENDLYKVGERNVSIAFQILKDFNIPIVAHHVGGNMGRKIVMNSTSGKVRMRLLGKPITQINEEINKGFGY